MSISAMPSLLAEYSTYGRGLESFIGTYRLLDIAPRGRDEDALDWPMQWIRHHDRYDTD